MTEIYNLKKIDLGRYLIEENIDYKMGMALIANPEQFGKNNFELMKMVHNKNTTMLNLLNELIKLSKQEATKC